MPVSLAAVVSRFKVPIREMALPPPWRTRHSCQQISHSGESETPDKHWRESFLSIRHFLLS